MRPARSTYPVEPIGVVLSELSQIDAAPLQGDEGAPEAWLELATDVAPGLVGIVPMEAIDGTPIIDLKPALGPLDGR